MYQVIKRYGAEQGWSCTFRQWRAEGSHCRYIHGYPLAFEIVFESDFLDARNWVMDFGGLKELKSWLQSTFDHKLIVAEDDPQLGLFKAMTEGPDPIADIVIVSDTSCEKFAEMTYYEADRILEKLGVKSRVRLVEVRVSEHYGNTASFAPSEVTSISGLNLR
jgi:6-pyruvoyltetrahydropterin/6-carboxytetrahydropterin synthase